MPGAEIGVAFGFTAPVDGPAMGEDLATEGGAAGLPPSAERGTAISSVGGH